MRSAAAHVDVTEQIIGACIEVHRELGPGLLESAYGLCLAHELTLRGVRFEQQRRLPLIYKGLCVPSGYRLDFVVEECVVVEVKAVAQLLPVHEAQVLTYLKLTGLSVGLLVNFNVAAIRSGGLRRLTARG
ncbi:MAG: GxxExxY protein [Steroidobacteraceae bacterium]